MADIIQIQELCLSLPGVEECFPFDETTLVFKVSGKMFALIPLEKDPHNDGQVRPRSRRRVAAPI